MKVDRRATEQPLAPQPSYLVGGIAGALSGLVLTGIMNQVFPNLTLWPASRADSLDSFFPLIMSPVAFGAVAGLFRTSIDRYNGHRKPNMFDIVGGNLLATGLSSVILTFAALANFRDRGLGMGALLGFVATPFLAMCFAPATCLSAEAARLANRHLRFDRSAAT